MVPRRFFPRIILGADKGAGGSSVHRRGSSKDQVPVTFDAIKERVKKRVAKGRRPKVNMADLVLLVYGETKQVFSGYISFATSLKRLNPNVQIIWGGVPSRAQTKKEALLPCKILILNKTLKLDETQKAFPDGWASDLDDLFRKNGAFPRQQVFAKNHYDASYIKDFNRMKIRIVAYYWELLQAK